MNPNPKWFKSVEKTSCKSNLHLGQGLQIEDIADGSPAEVLGLQVGDTLLNMNGQIALTTDMNSILHKYKSVNYSFYCLQSNNLMLVKTASLPLGIRTAPTSSGIVQKYRDEDFYGSEGWFTLWEREDYLRLRLAAQATQKKSLVGKLLGRKNNFPPAELLISICEIEAGDVDVGFAALDKFARSMYDWTTDFHALVYYYRGLRAQRDGDTPKFMEQLTKALEVNDESKRINKLANSVELQTQHRGSMVGRHLKFDYKLNHIKGGQGATSIGALLAAMPEGQVLPLCLMPFYRGNGPYNQALSTYINVYKAMKEHMHALVVLTDQTERRADRDYWFHFEDMADKLGIPLLILHEETASFGSDLNLRFAPSFVALDKSGQVVWNGDLCDDYGYWDMLAQAESLRQ